MVNIPCSRHQKNQAPYFSQSDRAKHGPWQKLDVVSAAADLSKLGFFRLD